MPRLCSVLELAECSCPSLAWVLLAVVKLGSKARLPTCAVAIPSIPHHAQSPAGGHWSWTRPRCGVWGLQCS